MWLKISWQQDAVRVNRLCPGAATYQSGQNVTFDSGPFAPLFDNVMSQNRQPQPQITCTENLAKFGHVVFEICEQTEGQTYTCADHNTLLMTS